MIDDELLFAPYKPVVNKAPTPAKIRSNISSLLNSC